MVLPASMRLRGHRCFNRLHRSSKRQHGTLMVLRVATGDSNLLRRELRGIQERTCRCALVISNHRPAKSFRCSKRRRRWSCRRRLSRFRLTERLLTLLLITKAQRQVLSWMPRNSRRSKLESPAATRRTIKVPCWRLEDRCNRLKHRCPRNRMDAGRTINQSCFGMPRLG